MLALWGSGVFKAGDPTPGFPASRTFADIPGHGQSLKTMSLLTFSKKMELALEFWSVPFRFLMNASANLLVFVAKILGVSWAPLGLAWVSLGPFGGCLGPLWDRFGTALGLPWGLLGSPGA